MNTQDVIESASHHLQSLSGQVFDILNLAKPSTVREAVNLTKVISKLSPFVGNLIEFKTVEFLNAQPEYQRLGEWMRQDPGFPDAVFVGSVSPSPGFEIKAWFPLATEITARFKDSQEHFTQDQTHVCLLAWLPERLIFGQPCIVDVCIVSGRSVAEARDNHYHKPPDYLVIEPEDTAARTRNLQQTNTNGYKFQGTPGQLAEAQGIVESWGAGFTDYRTSVEYQALLRKLQGAFPYRLDTNFAKMDRIMHGEIEDFKQSVLGRVLYGHSVKKWNGLLYGRSDSQRLRAVESLLNDQNSESCRSASPRRLIP